MAANWVFALFIDCCTRRSRFTGSGSLLARSASSIETRFWYMSSSSPVRTLTGTAAISGSFGRASFSMR